MINNTDIKDIVHTYGSPLYLFDYDELKKRVKEIRKRLGNSVKLCYAMKANPFLISYLVSDVDKFEVCSPGEYEICKKEKIPFEKIVFSGVYKQKKDFTECVKDDFSGVYTLESLEQFVTLNELVKNTDKKVKVLPRLTSGNQFGMDEKELMELISDVQKNPCLELCGIQYFSGTQKKNKEIIKRELEDIEDFCKRVYQETGVLIETIEYGPGLFVDYFGSKDQDYEMVDYLGNLLQEKRQYKFVIELGRYIAATCGIYLTRVVDVKCNKGKKYCMVDGGINHITYYGQMLGLKVPRVEHLMKENEQERLEEKWTVCGALCTVHDVLLRDYNMQTPRVGDILAFKNAGAYSITEASYLFLSRELPSIVLINANQEIKVLREKMSCALINSRNIEE